MWGRIVNWKDPRSALRALVLLTLVCFGSMLVLATVEWERKRDPSFFIFFVFELALVMSIVFPIWVKLYKKGRGQ